MSDHMASSSSSSGVLITTRILIVPQLQKEKRFSNFGTNCTNSLNCPPTSTSATDGGAMEAFPSSFHVHPLPHPLVHLHLLSLFPPLWIPHFVHVLMMREKLRNGDNLAVENVPPLQNCNCWSDNWVVVVMIKELNNRMTSISGGEERRGGIQNGVYELVFPLKWCKREWKWNAFLWTLCADLQFILPGSKGEEEEDSFIYSYRFIRWLLILPFALPYPLFYCFCISLILFVSLLGTLHKERFYFCYWYGNKYYYNYKLIIHKREEALLFVNVCLGIQSSCLLVLGNCAMRWRLPITPSTTTCELEVNSIPLNCTEETNN